MSHRTQITLEDEQYERLRRESRETGLGLAELVRRALDQVYASSSASEFERRLDLSFGAWADRADIVDGEAYVESLRSARSDRFAGL